MEFLQNVYTVFIQVLILAMLMLVGFCGVKFKYFTEQAARLCNNLLFYVVTPCVIVNSFMNVEYTKENSRGFFSAFLVAFVFHAIAMVLSIVFFNKGDKDKNVIYKYAMMFGNTGYMGLPLAKAVMQAVAGNGDLGTFYCSACVAVFNCFCFTYGVWLMSGNKQKFNWTKLIVNPGMLSVLVGIPLFIFNIELPTVLKTPIESLGSMNTPLALVMFGTYLANASFKGVFKQKNLYVTVIMKLIIIPLAMICGLRLIGIRGNLLIVASVFMSAPTANNTTMFAAKYDRDTGLATQVGGLCTIASIITMPTCVALGILLS